MLIASASSEGSSKSAESAESSLLGTGSMNVDGGSKSHDAFFIRIFESPAKHGRHYKDHDSDGVVVRVVTLLVSDLLLLKGCIKLIHMRGSRGGTGGPTPPEKSQKYRVS